MARVRKGMRCGRLLVAVALAGAGLGAASEAHAGCREVPHQDGTAEVCQSQAWFNCVATNPSAGTLEGFGSWDESPPEGPLAGQAGCARPDGSVPPKGGEVTPAAFMALGSADGRVDSLTVRLFALIASGSGSDLGSVSADVFVMVDGRGTPIRDVTLESQRRPDGITEVTFSVEDLGFLGDLENRRHQVGLSVHPTSPVPVSWVWDAEPVPASITFNPAQPAGTRLDADDVGVAAPLADPRAGPGAHDATVIAIVDTGFDPYHWDFVGSKMPQHRDADRSNDLPLEAPPDRWLSGFPDPDEAFASYQSLDLTFEHDDAFRRLDGLREADADEWDTVTPSTPGQLNYHWIPGSKVVGAITFETGEPSTFGTTGNHGQGTSSTAVGNLHGTCPECLLVFLRAHPVDNQPGTLAAFEWALDQPWIDVVSMSVPTCLMTPLGHDVYFQNCNDVDQQRRATERGQTIFFAAGNGISNFSPGLATNPTLSNSQQGPDWIVTVSAVTRTGHAVHAAGKPADLAGLGFGIGASSGAATVGGAGFFTGTSGATPLVAGTYARALHQVRRALPGPSRVQDDGVVAEGGRVRCGPVRPDCELGSGELTAAELRGRLLGGAVHTPEGTTMSFFGVGQVPPTPESEFLSEGHGSYFGRAFGEQRWRGELDRVLAPMEGRVRPLRRPEGERDWMVVDSFCRQELWGSWDGGYFVEGETSLPGPDPAWPLRTSIEATCPFLTPAPPM